jgi:hypothetical protein
MAADFPGGLHSERKKIRVKCNGTFVKSN